MVTHHFCQSLPIDLSLPKWRREPDFPGSIPGEIYANALYYFAPRTGIAVDPMAGSRMLNRVYEDRYHWQKDSDFQLEIQLYDLSPRRPFIRRHDARQPLPSRAHWIFLDPPYFSQARRHYEGTLATTTDYDRYIDYIHKILTAMHRSLHRGGRLCLLLPKWSGASPEDRNFDTPSDARLVAESIGLTWIDAAFVSRGRQQARGFAYQNIAAKRSKRLVSDTCVLNVFEKEKDSSV